MALTDPESFGKVTEIAPKTYEEALDVVSKEIDSWTEEAIKSNDKLYEAYVKNLKNCLFEHKDMIFQDAVLNSPYFKKPTRYTSTKNEEIIFENVKNRFMKWQDALDEGILKSVLCANEKYMVENKAELATSLQLVEAQKTEKPFTNGTAEKETPAVIQTGHSSSGSEDSKSTGGAPTDASTLPMTNPSVRTEEKEVEKEVVVATETKSSANPMYRKGAKKDFIWYHDDHSQPTSDVQRGQGVQASGINEYAPTKAKMDVDNPVPREQGVEASKIDSYDVEKANSVDLANPVPRDEGVESAPMEYIKMEENSVYRSKLRLIFKALKEHHEF